jgi:hypothetical protein
MLRVPDPAKDDLEPDLEQHTIGQPGDHITIHRVEETGCVYHVGIEQVWIGDEHIRPFIAMLKERANAVGLNLEEE